VIKSSAVRPDAFNGTPEIATTGSAGERSCLDDLGAVEPWHENIDDGEVEFRFLEFLDGGCAAVDCHDMEALGLKREHDGRAHVHLIVDDENALH
jgi:hypothetical protein